MVLRQRAIRREDKRERSEAILDAAARLLERTPEHPASMAEVAVEAGIAKGTIYLYFPGKEELLLAVHERNVERFFAALLRRLERPGPLAIGDMLDVVHEHILRPPTFLPLATHCQGLVGGDADGMGADAFMQRMAERLAAAGRGLETHFPPLAPGAGALLLRHTYALVLGLWQMAGAAGRACSAPSLPVAFAEDVDRALRALWGGTLAAGRA